MDGCWVFIDVGLPSTNHNSAFVYVVGVSLRGGDEKDSPTRTHGVKKASPRTLGCLYIKI
jgi:hypothetical protein